MQAIVPSTYISEEKNSTPYMFGKRQKLIDCSIALLTRERFLSVTSKRKSCIAALSFILSHFPHYGIIKRFPFLGNSLTGKVYCISTSKVNYISCGASEHVTRSLWHLCVVRGVPMKHRWSQPIKAAWEPAAALRRHWEWTVGLALIGREPESHLHLGQAALALNPHAPPFLPLGSSFARLPDPLQRRAAETSFTPTTDARRHGWTHTHTHNLLKHGIGKKKHTNQCKIFSCRLNFSQFNPAD